MRIRKTVLILAKTYPTPSEKYTETSCVAGIEENGEMIRLYPVPYRLLEKYQQFGKWQWIEVLTEKAHNDHRKESHKVLLDSNSPKILKKIDTKHWDKRFEMLDKIPMFTSFQELDTAREQQGVTLAILKPKRIEALEIEKEPNPEWTPEELEKLRHDSSQPDLFSNPSKELKQLRKMPYHFYYRYICDEGGKEVARRLKITDWEAGALYWNCSISSDWEMKFRQKYEQEFMQKDILFLMGNMHQFPHQWLIISVIYPPKIKQTEEQSAQASLF